MTLNIFTTLIISLFMVVCVLLVFRRAKLPIILGYLLVGIIIGPETLGLIQEPKHILPLADFGVMFLMFTIGLEFSFLQLKKMKYQVFVFGGSQIIFTVFIIALLAFELGLPLNQALIVAIIVAMSSSAIVLKQLMDQHNLKSQLGKDVTAILLFQDLSAIPFFILLSSLKSPVVSNAELFFIIIVKSILVIVSIIFIGHWVIRPLFREVAGTYSLEIFTLTALLIALSASWLTYNAGLTLALGGFLAGMLLSETEYRHQLEAVIRPFLDLLVGIFFISIGLLFSFKNLPLLWPWILILLLALTLVKILIVTAVVFLRRNLEEAIRAGLILAQGSEFGFALLTHALSLNLLPYSYGQAVLGALLVSMLLSTFLIKYNEKIANTIMNFVRKKEPGMKLRKVALESDLDEHVIICGYSKVGQSIGRILEKEKISHVGIEINQKLVEKAKACDKNVIYGDATLYEILATAKLKDAAAVVITFEQLTTVTHILEKIRARDKRIPIFLRTTDDRNLDLLKKQGATEVIPTSLETSLMIASHLLAALQVPAQKIWLRVNEIRKDRYNLLHNLISGQESTLFDKDFQKLFIKLQKDDYAVGHSLSDLMLDKKGILIIAIHRNGVEKFHLDLRDKLRPGDILRLYGLQTDLDDAQDFILYG